MELAKISGKLGLAALAVIASPLALANDAKWYGGVSVGESQSTIDDGRIIRGLLGSGLTAATINSDNRDTSYKVFGGYQFNRYFALEGGYFDLGKFGFRASGIPAGTLDGTIRIQGINLDAVGTLPLWENLSAFGRVGATYAETKDTFSGTGAIHVLDTGPQKLDTNYKYGIGLQYAFTKALAMRLEGERYRVNDAVGNHGDIDTISVGLVFRFGGKTPEPAPYTPAPVAAAARPAPPPPVVLVPVPLARVLTRVSFSVDSDFDFDKINLKDPAKQGLDKLVADLRGVNYDNVLITGNTDRLGTEAYNQKLSVRRAEAVRNYLVIRWGIPAEKVIIVGAGELAPDTRPGECVGEVATRTLVKCLAPDRRVDVEVRGTR